MASSKDTSSVPYTSLPSHPENATRLTSYRPSFNASSLLSHRSLIFIFTVLLLLLAVYFFYPSDPSLQISRVRLNYIHINTSPKLALDLSFSLSIRVHNKDYLSLDYDALDVAVGYRGRELGFTNSGGGKIRARASSYVNATLDLNGREVIYDALYLLEDLGSGVIPFDTHTLVKGNVGLLFFNIPIQGRVSCELYVNTNNQTVVRQDCYSE
ncbi:hypothetical protein K2173_013211 [Erythroxylum novogranatense]|uniref:Late embryogenesis abundant protein LEA-2 subgroup domain-containing protein n=1 Tax=Erythroxylum novogranatense TaxID=1862640 RepID=A0AAV8SCP2_9ROSI|nr:hypothetical protein K2173_013211 [Erythroxylum novogranatense]